MFKLTKNGTILRLSDGAHIPADLGNRDYIDFLGWCDAGNNPEPYVEPEKTPALIQSEVITATQNRLDDFARTRNYDGILSAATYAASTVPKFAAEGQYAVEARDATWAACYQIMADVESGVRPLPTVDEVLAELPPLGWPQ